MYALIVEETTDIADILGMYLKLHWRMSVVKADSAAVAIKSLINAKPKFILLDAHLTKGSVEEIIKFTRVHFSISPPVILMSTSHELGHRDMTRLKLQEFLPKPFDLEHLDTIVCKYLSD